MSDYITLLGAEEVGRAGHNMSGAADQMQRAAAAFESSTDRLERILDAHASRIEAAVELLLQTTGKAP